jgi:hypothetical protein
MPCRESFRILFKDHRNLFHKVIISSLIFPASQGLGQKTSGHRACALHRQSVACALDGQNKENEVPHMHE